MSKKLNMTDRTRVRRHSERSGYDRDDIYAVIDHALYGTIAFSDGKNVHAIPTAIWRENDYLYIHGSNGSRLLQALSKGAEACISITHIDALVLARAAISHSMNYRSVCIYGKFTTVTEDTAKNNHLKYFIEHWLPGRWQYLRTPDSQELAATTVLHIPITEAVYKARQGGPKDYPKDMQQEVWAGVIPLQCQWDAPEQSEEQGDVDLPGLARAMPLS